MDDMRDVGASLRDRGILFNERYFLLGDTAEDFANDHQLTSLQVVRTAFFSVDGKPWLVVTPADRAIEPARVAKALGAKQVTELPIAEVRRYVPEPQRIDTACAFGSRLNLPMLLDEPLTLNADIVVPTGERNRFLEMRLADYLELEQPNIAPIAHRIHVAPIDRERSAEVPPEPA
jgi:prolyl-tRNA editing enzyme YbaK/EbsC (Cys-tRNA(Pro) deacylase)